MSAEERDFLDEYREEDATETGDEVETEAGDEAEEVAETADKPEAETPEESEAPAAREAPKDTHVPYAAMKAEREKRQERERELQERDRRIAEYERQLHELRNPAPQQPKANIWEDPDRFIQLRIDQAVAPLRQQSFNDKLSMSEALVRDSHQDYDEKFAEVEEYCRANPGAGQQILSQPNPALAAYNLGKKLLEMKAIGDPEAYRAKIEAEVRAKIEAEHKAKEEGRRKAAEAIPPDLSESRNVAGNEPVVEDTFDTLFPRN